MQRTRKGMRQCVRASATPAAPARLDRHAVASCSLHRPPTFCLFVRRLWCGLMRACGRHGTAPKSSWSHEQGVRCRAAEAGIRPTRSVAVSRPAALSRDQQRSSRVAAGPRCSPAGAICARRREAQDRCRFLRTAAAAAVSRFTPPALPPPNPRAGGRCCWSHRPVRTIVACHSIVHRSR